MPDSQSHATRSMKLVALFTLCVGSALSWWGAFHEVVCGFILVGTSIEPFYAYAGCYAHSIGCIFGALLAPIVSRHFTDSNRRKGMLAILGLELFFTTLLFFHLSIHFPIAPTIMQVLINALACIAGLLALETLSRFTFKEVGTILVGVLCLFAFANYAVFPSLIRLPSGIVFIMAAEILLLVAAGIATVRFYRLSDELGLQVGAKQLADSDHYSERKAFAWQPVCFLAAYGATFGFMHVESSKLVVSFPERSIWLLAGIACATIIVSLFILKLNKRENIWRYYRGIVFPLIVCAFLMLQVHTPDVSAISIALVYASMFAFILLSVFACIRISTETAIPLTRVGRTAICVSYGFGLVGMSANHYLTFFVSYDALDSPLTAIVVFVALCAATFWVGDDRSARKIWGLRIEKDPRSLKDNEFEQCVDALAKRYCLTAKERTILALLVKGKRANQISEEQFISVNTVRTHIRNVYNKLDVHSHQELLKKFDEE